MSTTTAQPFANHFGQKIPQSSELFKDQCKLNRSEWKFTKDKTYSLVTECELVCDNAWMGSLANSGLFIGWGLSGPFPDILSIYTEGECL